MRRPLPLLVVLASASGLLVARADGPAPAPAQGGAAGAPAPRADAAADGGVAPPADAPADGEYVLVDPDGTDRAARATIDAAIAGLHPSMRAPFRAQLEASSRAPRRLGLARDEGALVVTWDGRAVRASLGAPAVPATGPEGRRVDVTHALSDGVYLVRYGHARMTRTTRIARSPHGLLVTTELRTGLLPRPLAFEARYGS